MLQVALRMGWASPTRIRQRMLRTACFLDPGSPAGGKHSPRGPWCAEQEGVAGGGGRREKPQARGVWRWQERVCIVSVHICVYKHAWRLGYLGAVPGQNLPFAAGQCDLLLDGAFKFIWKKGKEVKGAQEAMMGTQSTQRILCGAQAAR